MAHRVLIVGAGQIGAFYDTPEVSHILTYAHAFRLNPKFEFVGFVEPDRGRGEKAVSLWGGQLYSDIQEAFQAESIQVVCVAVPDAAHFEVILELANYPFDLLIAEKPFTQSHTDAQQLAAVFEARNTPVLVNYTRRYLPAFIQLAQRIRDGHFGRLLQGSALYGKGSIHNGSHLINLLLFFFGQVEFLERTSSFVDYTQADPTASVRLAVGPMATPFCVQGIDSRLVSIFEFDLLFEFQRVRITQGGRFLEFYEVSASAVFAGYREYVHKETRESELWGALGHLVEHADEVLTGRAIPLSSTTDALETLAICSRFHE